MENLHQNDFDVDEENSDSFHSSDELIDSDTDDEFSRPEPCQVVRLPPSHPKNENNDDDDGWEILQSPQPNAIPLPHKNLRPRLLPDSSTSSDEEEENIVDTPARHLRKDHMNSPAQFSTLTKEGWVTLLSLDEDNEQVGEDRFAILQPSTGLFLFNEEEEASAWKSQKDSSPFYQAHLFVSSFKNVSVRKESIDKWNALIVERENSVLVSLAFSDSVEREAWLHAMCNASMLASYLERDPSGLLAKSLLAASRTLTALSFDALSNCSFQHKMDLVHAVGRHLISLKLINCVQDLDLLAKTLESTCNLQTLHLGDNRLTSLGWISPLIHLQELSVPHCQLRDKDLVFLATYIRTGGQANFWQSVDVSRNPLVTSEGVTALSTVLFNLDLCPRMQSVNFSGCHLIGNACCKVWSLLLDKQLKFLDVSDIGITSTGLNVLFENGIKLRFCTVDFRKNKGISLQSAQEFKSKQDTNTFLFSLLENDSPDDELMLTLTTTTPLVVDKQSTSVITCFGRPLPNVDRLKLFIFQELALLCAHPVRNRISLSRNSNGKEGSFVLVIEEDQDYHFALKLQAKAKAEVSKYALFRIDSISTSLSHQESEEASILLLENPSVHFLTDSAVSLSLLKDAVRDFVCTRFGKTELVRFQMEGCHSQLNPTLMKALKFLLSSQDTRIFLAALGEADDVGFMETVSCTTGDVKQLHKSKLQLMKSAFPLWTDVNILDNEEESLPPFFVQKLDSLLFASSGLNVVTVCEVIGMAISNNWGDELHDYLARKQHSRNESYWKLVLVCLYLVPARNELLRCSLCFLYARNHLSSELSLLACHEVMMMPTFSNGSILPVKQRLLVVSQLLQPKSVLVVSVLLPDKTAVMVEVSPFSSFSTLLVLVNKKLFPFEEEGDLFRWRGFGFLGGAKLLPFELDCVHWAVRNPKEKLHLVCCVNQGFPVERDLLRMDLLFASTLGHSILNRYKYFPLTNCGQDAHYYFLLLLVIERIGEDSFRFDMSQQRLVEYVERHFNEYLSVMDNGGLVDKECLERFRVQFLASERLSPSQCKSSLLMLSRKIFPLAVTGKWFDRVELTGGQLSNNVVLLDANVVKNKLLQVHVGAQGVLFFSRDFLSVQACLFQVPLGDIVELDVDDTEVRFRGNNALYVRIFFPIAHDAQLFRDYVVKHVWHHHLGDLELNDELFEAEYAFHFPNFPALPTLHKLVISPQQFHTVKEEWSIQLSSGEEETHNGKFYARIVANQLLKPKGSWGEILLGPAPQQPRMRYMKEALLHDGTKEEEEAEFFPPLSPPPEDDVEIVPPSSPPPIFVEDDILSPPPPLLDSLDDVDMDDDMILPPPGPPPPMEEDGKSFSTLLPVESPLLMPPLVVQNKEVIPRAMAPPSFLSAEDLSSQKKPLQPPPAGMTMMQEMQWKRAQKEAITNKESTANNTVPVETAVPKTITPVVNKLETKNLALESLLGKRNAESALLSGKVDEQTPLVETPVLLQTPPPEEDEKAKKIAEFRRAKAAREAAASAGQ